MKNTFSFEFIHLFMLISAFIPNDSSKIDNITQKNKTLLEWVNYNENLQF